MHPMFIPEPYKALFRKCFNPVHQEWVSYGLLYDLQKPQPLGSSSSDLVLRPFVTHDLDSLLEPDLVHASRAERREVVRRIEHLAQDIPCCLVAEDPREQEPVFMQWMMTANSNDAIQRYFKGRFPRLHRGDALLENAYIPKRHRGKGVMSRAISAVVEHARGENLRWLVTFIDKHNTPSLKGCLRAGFYPFAIRRDVHICFHRIKWRTFS